MYTTTTGFSNIFRCFHRHSKVSDIWLDKNVSLLNYVTKDFACPTEAGSLGGRKTKTSILGGEIATHTI